MKFASLALTYLCFSTLVCRAQDLTLVREGRSPFTIMIAADASPSVHRGATELQSHLKKMSGADLPIATDDKPLPDHAILVGRTRYTDSLKPDVDPKSLGVEDFALESHGNHILILGSDDRGAMYGCTALLEKLGVRWFTNRITYVPNQPTVTLAPFHDRQSPDFEYREPFIGEAFDKDWA